MQRFESKSILLVGGYSAIGITVAQRLAAEGASIVAVGRDETKLREAVASLPGPGHEAIVADAASWDQLQPVVEIGKRRGGFAGAVVCAGSHVLRPISVLDNKTLNASFDANVATALLATRAFAKVTAKEGGSMVWLSSTAALLGSAAFAPYAAAKGALISASRVAAVELASRRIRVNVVVAGAVKSDMSQKWIALLNDQQRETMERRYLLGTGQTQDVADPIVFLLSDDARWMTGSVLTVDGGFSIH
jgi:NAD(P)-dependent dehydrogenase (short-subunit alcohol dehydrogenase family)